MSASKHIIPDRHRTLLHCASMGACLLLVACETADYYKHQELERELDQGINQLDEEQTSREAECPIPISGAMLSDECELPDKAAEQVP
jgi:hypothetical protein